MALDLAVSSLAARALGQTHSSSLTSGLLTHCHRWTAAPELVLSDYPLLAALTDLFKALQGPDRVPRAQELLSHSPCCDELLGLWDAQQKV